MLATGVLSRSIRACGRSPAAADELSRARGASWGAISVSHAMQVITMLSRGSATTATAGSNHLGPSGTACGSLFVVPGYTSWSYHLAAPVCRTSYARSVKDAPRIQLTD
jgi:hypothetical protein